MDIALEALKTQIKKFKGKKNGIEHKKQALAVEQELEEEY